MSNYATKDALLQLSRVPRVYADVEIPRWGPIQVQTVNAGEFCRIDAARNAAVMAAADGDMDKAAEAFGNYFVVVATTCIAQPAFVDSDRDLLLAIDGTTAAAIKKACLDHCDMKEVSVEGSEKNSVKTSGGSEPSGSGST
jgi:hypothetical protein